MNQVLLNAFYEEADEMFNEIETNLLEIENNGVSKERIDSLFRSMHTLKGSSSTMEIFDMAKLTHLLEDQLGSIRDGKMEFSDQFADLMFKGLDQLRLKVEKHKSNESYKIDVDEFFSSESSLENFKKISGKINPNNMDKEKLKNEIEDGQKAYLVEVFLDNECPLKGARLFIVTNTLNSCGKVYRTGWSSIPVEEIDGEEFSLVYISDKSPEYIKNSIEEITNIKSVKVSELDLTVKENTRGPASSSQQSIRVSISKLDKLLKVVEELSVDKERLKHIAQKISEKYNMDNEDQDILDLYNLAHHLDLIGNEIQDSVMSTRMYTMQNVFQRFPRMVRDLALKQNKEIQLIIEGENTELDRSVAEKIIDPLNHIVRNSIDHGIELPEDREKAGKNRQGTIKITAGHEENSIFIRIEDDGRGLSAEKLRKSAISKGLLTEEQLLGMDENQIHNIIFMPGFSTNQEVTDVSGRGVGMNVVKENIENINGTIELTSKEGQGLCISLKLPLTLAIIDSLIIGTKNYNFAVPLLSVLEIFKIDESSIQEEDGQAAINWRGEQVPFVRAAHIFGDENGERDNMGILLTFSNKKLVLAVNDVLGQQQIVLKSIEKYMGKDKVLGEQEEISGVSILDNGDFAYVLDVYSIVGKFYWGGALPC